MQNAQIFWDNIAPNYAKSPIADMDAYNYTLERTRSYLQATDDVLEIGCGTGSTALLLAPNVRQITASDLSENMIKVGIEKAHNQGISNVAFIKADIQGGTIANGSYDAVLAFNLLHLIEDLRGAIKQINLQMKSGGTFISKTVCKPAKGMPFKFRLIKMILPLMQLIGKAPYVKFMEISELEKIITAGGFKIIETGNYPDNPPNRYIVAQKI